MSKTAGTASKLVKPVNTQISAYVKHMTEMTEQRKNRLASFARDAVSAMSDYRLESDAVVARTARLRAERLARGAVIPLPAPPKKGKVASRARKSSSRAAVGLKAG